MFSLLITIISIALTVAVAGGTMYYIGSSTDQGTVETAAAELLSQSEQLGVAIQMHSAQDGSILSDVDQLVAKKYLSTLPVPPDAVYSTGQIPSANDWQIMQAGKLPVVTLHAKLREDACLALNKQHTGNAVITQTLNPRNRIQCFGTSEPYTVVVNQSGDEAVLTAAVTAWNANPDLVAGEDAVIPLPEATGGAVVTSGDVKLAIAALPQWKVGQFVNYDFKALFSDSQDAAPLMSEVVWSAEGTLPAGLVLDSATGVLSGTPTAKGTLDYTVKATYKDATGQQVYKIVVQGIELEVVSVHAGEYHTCALTPAGGVKCWGRNHYGQLGNNSDTASLVPVDVVGLTSGVASISVGARHTCALTTAGGAKCWGYNAFGQLGDTSYTNSWVPVDVADLTSGVASIVSGWSHTCAVTTAGGAKCWGLNHLGELGNNSTTTSWVPVDVEGLTSGVASISAGAGYTCAVTTSGGAKCWGSNGYGRLGNNSTTDSWVPVNVVGLESGVATISAGGSSHTCAVTTSGGAKCWGSNSSGQLGNNSKTTSLVPVDVEGLTSGVASIRTGTTHTCAVTTAGGAKCWGYNTNGQLGNNSTTGSSVPVDVWGLATGVVAISALGSSHTCAVTTSGGAKCWGTNGYGQLGNNSNTDSLVPVDVLNP